jgi:stress-induced morphogen
MCSLTHVLVCSRTSTLGTLAIHRERQTLKRTSGVQKHSADQQVVLHLALLQHVPTCMHAAVTLHHMCSSIQPSSFTCACRVEVIADAFQGKLPVARHRLVYDALKEELAAGLHALALKTKTPAAWAAAVAALDSTSLDGLLAPQPHICSISQQQPQRVTRECAAAAPACRVWQGRGVAIGSAPNAKEQEAGQAAHAAAGRDSQAAQQSGLPTAAPCAGRRSGNAGPDGGYIAVAQAHGAPRNRSPWSCLYVGRLIALGVLVCFSTQDVSTT